MGLSLEMSNLLNIIILILFGSIIIQFVAIVFKSRYNTLKGGY